MPRDAGSSDLLLEAGLGWLKRKAPKRTNSTEEMRQGGGLTSPYPSHVVGSQKVLRDNKHKLSSFTSESWLRHVVYFNHQAQD